MALNVLNQIPPLSLAGNPVKINVRTDNLYTTLGLKTIQWWTITDFAVGETLTLEWTDIDNNPFSRTYTCADISEIQGNDFPPGAFPYEKYFAENYELAFTFDYEFDVYHRFTAKEESTVVTMLITGDNRSLAWFQNGVTPVARDMYIHCEVFEQSDSGLRYIATDAIKPDQNGDVIFNIAEYIEGLFNDFIPDFESSNFEIVSGAVKKYKFRLFEFYDLDKHNEYDGSYFNGNLLSYDFSAINGAVSNEQFEGYEASNTNFYDQLIFSKEFITQQPRKKWIDILTTDFLYFYFFNETVTQLKYKADIYFTDGTNTTLTLNTVSSPEQYKIYQILTGYVDSGVKAQETASGKTARYYKVYITDQADTKISEEFIININRKYYKVRNEYIFRNALGMYDAIWFHGHEEFETKYTREFFEKLTRIIQRKPDIDTEHTVNTGWINRDTKEYLQGMFAAPEMYEGFYTEYGKRYYRKILVLNDSISPVLDSDIYREQGEMIYRFDSREKVYTKFRFPVWILDEGQWDNNGFWINYKLWNFFYS